MRILFIVCGIGFGHASRSLKIINKLYRLGYEVHVITSGDALQYFIEEGLDNLYGIPGMGIKWSGVGFSPLYSAAHYLHRLRYYKSIINLERKIIDKVSPDLIVIDSRPISLISTRIYRRVPRIVLTNQLSIASNSDIVNELVLYRLFPRIWFTGDKIAVLDLPPPYTITYRNNVDVISRYPHYLDGRLVFTGPIIDRPRLDDANREREWDVGFYISAPFYDKKLFTLDVVRYIGLLDGHRVRASLGDPGYKGLSIEAGNLRLDGWVRDKYEFLTSIKIVVLRGGQTSIFESIYASTPMLVIPAANQTEQIENANRVSELGIGEWLDYRALRRDPGILRGKVMYMLDNYDEYLENLAKIKTCLVKYNGLDLVVRLICSMVG